MKILFVRHGESQDDIDNKYGGWADFELTTNGSDQILSSLRKIMASGEKYDKVLTSPLKRAESSAKLIAEGLGLSLEIFEYVKEKNSYGVLSGMKKDEAEEKYPDQVKKLEVGEFVDGSEREEDLLHRIKRSLELLSQRQEESLIIVTHGSFLKGLAKTMLKKLTKKEDGGMVLVKLEDGSLSVLESNGIEFE